MEFIQDGVSQIFSFSPQMVLGVSVIAACYALKAMPFFPNQLIPVICILMPTILCPLVWSWGQAPQNILYPQIHYALVGFIIGVGAWIVHDKVLRHFIDRYVFTEKLKPCPKCGALI